MEFETRQRLLQSRDLYCECGRIIVATRGDELICPTCDFGHNLCDCPRTIEARTVEVLERIALALARIEDRG